MPTPTQTSTSNECQQKKYWDVPYTDVDADDGGGGGGDLVLNVIENTDSETCTDLIK